MVSFTRQLFNSSTPNFTGRSRGIRAERPLLPRNIPENLGNISGTGDSGFSAVDDLFGTAAGIIGPATQVVDQVITDRIRNEATEQVDAIRDEFGVGDATTREAQVGSGVLPEEIATATTELNNLTQAYRQGTLRSSSYWARLESTVRQLRTRYPGHRDQIDNIVSRLTGAVPANQLRRALLQEATTASNTAQAEANRTRQLVARFGEFVSQEVVQGTLDGSISVNTFLDRALTRRRELQDVQSDKAKIELERARGGATIDRARTAATREVWTNVKQALEDSGGLFDRLEETVSNLDVLRRTEGAIPEQEAEEARTLFRALSNQLRGLTNEVLTQEDYISLPETEKESIRSGIRNYLETMERNLVNGEIGALTVNTRLLRTATEQNRLELLQNDNVARINAIQDLLSPELVNTIFARNPAGLTDLHAQLKNVVLGKALNNRGGVNSLDQAFRELSANNITNREAFRKLENDFKTILVTPGVEEQLSLRTAELLYGDRNQGYLDSLDDIEKLRAFLNLTSNDVTDKILELSETRPDILTNYARWAGLQFRSLLLRPGADVQTGVTTRENIRVTFNPNTNRFQVQQLRRRSITDVFDPLQLGERLAEGSVRESVDTVNRALANLVPIIQADVGREDVSREVQSLILSIGVNTEASRQPTDFRLLFRAIRQRIEETQEDISVIERDRALEAGRRLDELLILDEPTPPTGVESPFGP